MTDFLENLVERSFGEAESLQPRAISRFEADANSLAGSRTEFDLDSANLAEFPPPHAAQSVATHTEPLMRPAEASFSQSAAMESPRLAASAAAAPPWPKVAARGTQEAWNQPAGLVEGSPSFEERLQEFEQRLNELRGFSAPVLPGIAAVPTSPAVPAPEAPETAPSTTPDQRPAIEAPNPAIRPRVDLERPAVNTDIRPVAPLVPAGNAMPSRVLPKTNEPSSVAAGRSVPSIKPEPVPLARSATEGPRAVKITIGRVEIKAATRSEPKAPRAQAPATARTVSSVMDLAEYVRLRQRGEIA